MQKLMQYDRPGELKMPAENGEKNVFKSMPKKLVRWCHFIHVLLWRVSLWLMRVQICHVCSGHILFSAFPLFHYLSASCRSMPSCLQCMTKMGLRCCLDRTSKCRCHSIFVADASLANAQMRDTRRKSGTQQHNLPGSSTKHKNKSSEYLVKIQNQVLNE